MGVKHAREYDEINQDLRRAISKVERSYELLEIDRDQWEKLDKKEQKDYMTTLADDIFFALGSVKSMNVGKGVVRYIEEEHIITVFDGEKSMYIINLI